MNECIQIGICEAVPRRRGHTSRSRATSTLLLIAALFASSAVLPQTKPDAAPLPREGGLRPSTEVPTATRFEESIQHGFFGDLSRPAPPALNRIQGIRIPDATKAPTSEEASRAATAKPAVEAAVEEKSPSPTVHITEPLRESDAKSTDDTRSTTVSPAARPAAANPSTP